MKSQNTAEAASAVADLQEKWGRLNDLDRARAVHIIHQAGVSLRQLAKALKCSPTLLRNLNLAAQAPLPETESLLAKVNSAPGNLSGAPGRPPLFAQPRNANSMNAGVCRHLKRSARRSATGWQTKGYRELMENRSLTKRDGCWRTQRRTVNYLLTLLRRPARI
jgi:lambda repressor-like predicted transcriptional regulator